MHVRDDAVADFGSSLFGKTLTLIVGPEAKHFTVQHADRLTSMSEYFRIALKGGWQEAKNDTFTLSEENASVFGFFLEWLYDPHLHYTATEDSFRFLWRRICSVKGVGFERSEM